MKTMQKFFMMMVVVLMTGFMTSCGSDDDNNTGPLGTFRYLHHRFDRFRTGNLV